MIIDIVVFYMKQKQYPPPLHTHTPFSLRIDILFIDYRSTTYYVILLWPNGKRNNENPLYCIFFGYYSWIIIVFGGSMFLYRNVLYNNFSNESSYNIMQQTVTYQCVIMSQRNSEIMIDWLYCVLRHIGYISATLRRTSEIMIIMIPVINKHWPSQRIMIQRYLEKSSKKLECLH